MGLVWYSKGWTIQSFAARAFTSVSRRVDEGEVAGDVDGAVHGIYDELTLILDPFYSI